MAGKSPRKPPDAAPRPGATPVLLAGGNPRIPKGYGDAPVQAYLRAMPGWKSGVGQRLDALIGAIVPGVRRAVRYNSPFYGADGEEGWFLSFHVFDRYIKVGFFRGALLRPAPPVPSRTGDTRYFHIHEDDRLDEALLSDLVGQACRLPGVAM